MYYIQILKAPSLQGEDFLLHQRDLISRLSTPKRSLRRQDTPCSPLKGILKRSSRKESNCKTIRIQESRDNQSISQLFEQLKQSIQTQITSQKTSQ